MTFPRPLVFARVDARSSYGGRAFGVLEADLRRHMYVIGKTGSGKTALLERLLLAEIRAGHGVGLLDPHGDLAERILERIPRERTNDVVLFDPADREFPLGMNMLSYTHPAERPLVVSAVLSVFRKVFHEFWGPRLEHVFRNALFALLSVRGTTLLGVLRMLVEEKYRASIVKATDDPVVRLFWTLEFPRLPKAFAAEVVAPVQNKVSAVLTNPLIRNIMGQQRASLRPREIMDDGRILIANLSKGRIGEDASLILGAFLLGAFQLAAYSRADTPLEKRKPYTLYIDEFQSWSTPSFGELLSEARKYGLSLVLAHQHLAQLDESLRRSVLGNAGTIVSFRVGGEDAELLAQEFAPEILASDLTRLGRHQLAIRLAVHGITSPPFTAVTLAPEEVGVENQAEIIRRISRERYGRPRLQVEEQVCRQLGVSGTLPWDAVRKPESKRRTPRAEPDTLSLL